MKSIFAALLYLCAIKLAIGQQPQFLLAETMPKDINPSAYLVSEKLDGVRAQWDGKQLRLRSGGVVLAPHWFLKRLPSVVLDGELWIARGQFERVSAAIRRADPKDATWQEINYMIFELPAAPGSFTARAAKIRDIVASCGFAQLQAVPQLRITSHAELMAMLESVTRQGGEGLMLHLAEATYQTGRSDALLKLKLADDAEATVLRHLPGKGRIAGLMGAIEVRLENGKTFKIGSGFTDAVRRQPPPIGSVVTFRYRGWTRHGLPRFATFLRIRELP